MRIKTDASALSEFEFIAMEKLDGSLEPAKKYQSDDEDSFNGKPVFRLGNVYVKENGFQNQNVSVKVLSKPEQPINELTKVKLTGVIYITPWVKNGRQALSIIADGVEAVK